MSKILKRHKLTSTVIVLYLTLLVTNHTTAIAALNNSLYYLKEMLMIMPVIFMLTVAVDALVPKSMVVKHMGPNAGYSGYLYALVLGSVSAGPIYAAFPICRILLEKGAKVGNIVIIIGAWAVIKVPMLANEAKFIGPKFMVLRWVLTVIALLIMAKLIEKLVPQIALPTSVKINQNCAFKVDHSTCISCGACVRQYPQLFNMANGKIQVTCIDATAPIVQQTTTIIKTCPTGAITTGGLND